MSFRDGDRDGLDPTDREQYSVEVETERSKLEPSNSNITLGIHPSPDVPEVW